MYEIDEKIKAIKQESDTLKDSRTALIGAIEQARTAQTSAPDVTQPFIDKIRDLKKQKDAIGKGQVAEVLLRQYEKERTNTNLMEEMDSYNETTRGSLQKFFEMFEAGRTTSEVIRHYAKNGIQIPEQFCSKVKKQFESYKKLKLELGFSEQEAKDFKKALDLSQKEDTKKLSTKIFKK